jgi:hypothetical protein
MIPSLHLRGLRDLRALGAKCSFAKVCIFMRKFLNDFFNEACPPFLFVFLRCLIRVSNNPVVAWSVFRPLRMVRSLYCEQAKRMSMIWARLIAVMPLILCGAVCAQSANEIVTPFESCFRSSRLADAICMRQNDPAQRLDCLRKTSATQLECLEHLLPKGATASENSSRTVPSGPPANAASSDPSKGASPKEPGRTEPPGVLPKGAAASQDSSGAVSSGPPANAASSETPLKGASPKEPVRTESPGVSTGSIPAKEADNPPKADLTTNPLSDDVAATIRLDVPGQIVDVAALPAQTNWIVSETTSPLKYRTVVTAVIHATPVAENGPNTLTIGCKRQRTELSVGMEGDFAAPRHGKPQIDSQINDQPAVRRRWAWSAHRKLATYKDDPVGLLQSVPEGATLKIAVSDRENVRHEATFQLTGLDPVRNKVATACKWAPV